MTDPLELSVLSPTGLLLTLLVAVLYGAYTIGFWRWKNATPGKLIVGLKVRRREVGGRMPWEPMILRFLVMNAFFLGGSGFSVFDLLVTGFLVINYLWPLWDDKNQALHDKAAKTNVVVA